VRMWPPLPTRSKTAQYPLAHLDFIQIQGHKFRSAICENHNQTAKPASRSLDSLACHFHQHA